MSKEKLKGKCSRCRNLQVLTEIPLTARFYTGVKPIQPPRHGTLPAPEFTMRPYYYKCKVTNEFLTRDDVETERERECEHFKDKDEKVLICQKCGAQNPTEYRFCGNCGQSLYSHV